MQLPCFSALEAEEIYFARVVIHTVWTIAFAIFIFAVPINILVGGFKNKIAPAVVNFHIHIFYIFIWRTILLLQGSRSGRIAGMENIVVAVAIGSEN